MTERVVYRILFPGPNFVFNQDTDAAYAAASASCPLDRRVCDP